MSFRVLKWLAIILPLLFLVAVDGLRHLLFPGQFYSSAAIAFYFALVAIAIFLFSHGVFGLVNRLQRRILAQNRHLEALNSIAAASAESPGLESLLNTALKQVLGILQADAGLICVVNLEEREHSAAASHGFSSELVSRIQRVKLGDDPIAEEVVLTRRPVVIERVFEDPRVAEAAQREGIRSAISVPLKAHGEVTGILVIGARRERRFTAADLDLLDSVGGQLGMAIRNATLFDRSLQRNREMEALLSVSRAVASSLDLPQVLDRALETILDVTSAEAVEIWLAEAGGELVLKRHRGAAAEAFHERTRFGIGEGCPGLAAQTHSPVVIHDLPREPSFLRTGVKEAGFQTYCALPLLLRENLLGVLGVAAQAQEALTKPEELRLLAGIGEVISVAIENARLYERVQDIAILEERDRIAREMHDGFAQVLGYVNTKAFAVRHLLAEGKTDEAGELVAQLEEAARQVYADVREAILGLRTTTQDDRRLVAQIRDYLELFGRLADIKVRCRLQNGVAGLQLPVASEIQVLRIIQEALSNVRKHARATEVTVRLAAGDGHLRVVVADNGRGFDPTSYERGEWPQFGLQTMRERAEAVGGRFQLHSAPGRGSKVTVSIPIELEGKRTA